MLSIWVQMLFAAQRKEGIQQFLIGLTGINAQKRVGFQEKSEEPDRCDQAYTYTFLYKASIDLT